MKKIFEFQCQQCQEYSEGLIEYEDIADVEQNEPCPLCGGKLKRVFKFGYAKFNGSGFTKRNTNG